MNQPVKLSEKDDFGRDIYYLFIPNLEKFPAELKLSSKNFVLFLAIDANDLDADALGDWSDIVIDNGIANLCAWGEDCERVHDIMDESIIERQVVPHIMTSWHAEETLEDAIWFALFAASSVEEYKETCQSLLIVVVEDKKWDEYLRRELSSVQNFNKMVLSKYDNVPSNASN